MLEILAHRTYRHLFLAQVVAMLGTGLATVALGLLAYDLAGGDAALVLGTALTIKMLAYVLVAPVAGAFADRVPRRTMLVALDLIRGAVALSLPFVNEVWQIYLLIFVLQSASAAFTPTFQATIPDILTDEAQYTRALSLSRLAYEVESLLSPAIAAVLLLAVSYDALFFGTVAGFLASAFLVVTVVLPSPAPEARRGIYDRTTRGIRIFAATPRLRGLMGLNLAVAAASAMVIVNTVVIVRSDLSLGDEIVALTMGAFGGGSMIAAFLLPGILDRHADRPIMMGAGAAMLACLLGLAGTIAVFGINWVGLMIAWALTGLFYSAVQTPAGRLLRRSAHPEDRPAVFAAQFALSHACWLVGYPLAGWLMTRFGVTTALIGMSFLGIIGVLAAVRLWPSEDPEVVPHAHDDLPPDHPHLAKHDGDMHQHIFVIDDLHARWPKPQDVRSKT